MFKKFLTWEESENVMQLLKIFKDIDSDSESYFFVQRVQLYFPTFYHHENIYE